MEPKPEYKYPANIFEAQRYFNEGNVVLEVKHSSEDSTCFRPLSWASFFNAFVQHPGKEVKTDLSPGCVRMSRALNPAPTPVKDPIANPALLKEAMRQLDDGGTG